MFVDPRHRGHDPPEGVRRYAKARRHANALDPRKLPQVGALAAHERDLRLVDLFQTQHVTLDHLPVPSSAGGGGGWRCDCSSPLRVQQAGAPAGDFYDVEGPVPRGRAAVLASATGPEPRGRTWRDRQVPGGRAVRARRGPVRRLGRDRRVRQLGAARHAAGRALRPGPPRSAPDREQRRQRLHRRGQAAGRGAHPPADRIVSGAAGVLRRVLRRPGGIRAGAPGNARGTAAGQQGRHRRVLHSHERRHDVVRRHLRAQVRRRRHRRRVPSATGGPRLRWSRTRTRVRHCGRLRAGQGVPGGPQGEPAVPAVRAELQPAGRHGGRTFAEVQRLVDTGELGPDDIHLPGVFVDDVFLARPRRTRHDAGHRARGARAVPARHRRAAGPRPAGRLRGRPRHRHPAAGPAVHPAGYRGHLARRERRPGPRPPARPRSTRTRI